MQKTMLEIKRRFGKEHTDEIAFLQSGIFTDADLSGMAAGNHTTQCKIGHLLRQFLRIFRGQSG